MKVSVKFIKPHIVKIEGRMVDCRVDEIREIEEKEALQLFKAGVVLPGPQTTEPQSIWE